MLRIMRVALLGCGILLACDSHETPAGPSFAEFDGLELTLELEETSVAVGSSFEITVTAANHGMRRAEFMTPHGCFALPSVERSGERQEEFINIGCATVVTHWEVGPGEQLRHSYTIPVGNRNGTPEPGEYVLKVEFPTDPALPALRKSFRVTP